MSVGDVKSDIGYAGYFHHEASGLDLTANRAYDAQHARWLNRDPIGEAGGVNLYGYVGGNPVNLVDPMGTDVFVVNTPQVGGYHQKIVVGSPFGGQYGQSFGLLSRDLQQQSPWSAYHVTPGPGVAGSGIVYTDNDPISKWGSMYLRTSLYEDRTVQQYLQQQKGDTGPYNLATNNCRTYSQNQFDKIVEMVWQLRWGPQ